MGDDLTFDQLWVAGDDDANVVQGAIDIEEPDDDAVILENPSEDMRKPPKRKLGAMQASVAPTRAKHQPKNRPVPLTEEQLQRRRDKIAKLKAKRREYAKAMGTNKQKAAPSGTALKVLTESAANQAEYFWSEYCRIIGGDLSIPEIGDAMPACGIQSLGKFTSSSATSIVITLSHVRCGSCLRFR